jgi:phospholipid/cholesterol/gamma-HCH transport system ATP-binding protein
MTIIIEEHRTILQFKAAVLRADADNYEDTEELNVSIYGGDFVLIRLTRLEQTSIFADASAGLIKTVQGAVSFLGNDWQRLPPDLANAMRGRIGRVFSSGNWIRRLSLMENILLPQLHHTRRPLSDILGEVAELAERFHLAGIPLDLPGDCRPAELRYAACVRAFLGRPNLVLLEEPTGGSFFEIVPPLINTIRDARNRGSAVIWLTRHSEIWNDRSLPVNRRYRLAGRRLLEVAP